VRVRACSGSYEWRPLTAPTTARYARAPPSGNADAGVAIPSTAQLSKSFSFVRSGDGGLDPTSVSPSSDAGGDGTGVSPDQVRVVAREKDAVVRGMGGGEDILIGGRRLVSL
jgi:hypothetical protein